MESNKKINDNIFGFIYGCALHDAVMQKAFKGKKKGIEDVVGAKNAVKKYIDSILNGKLKDQPGHDKLFLETAHKVCDEINEENDTEGTFTFGNAQKLLNMAVKYTVIRCYNNLEMRKNFEFCHCPMDSKMLEHVWDNYIEKHKNDEGITINKKTEFCAPWSKENFEEEEFPTRYELFQKGVRKLASKQNVFPIEYDYIAWNA